MSAVICSIPGAIGILSLGVIVNDEESNSDVARITFDHDVNSYFPIVSSLSECPLCYLLGCGQFRQDLLDFHAQKQIL